ncbi:dendritic arbor reduction protein 1 [Drosophila grimshawi]|uniref:GH15769 n=1 Tax=Drosophila grimshawi TaxID=7222 RepID=B4IZ36_DROGR|nr:dendritic arbor reduction protein 1 [Drosophila grimshawi]EDV95558.1 GH15769 [Drosophila grimshawi]
MATVAHGCSSPRQRSCNGSSSPGGHHGSTPAMYTTTMPKYSRTSSQTLYATSQQIFESPYNGHASLYMPGAVVGGGAGVGAAGTISQRPLSASALPESTAGCRNYWSQSASGGHGAPHSTAFYHSSGRHYNNYNNKRKSAVELLAESKPFYIKSEAVFERLQQASYRNANSGKRREERHYDELEDRRYMSLTRQQQQQQYATLHNHHQQQQQQQQQQQHPQSHPPHHQRSQPNPGNPGHRSNPVVNNNVLQHKLRLLLGNEAAKERSLRRESNTELLATDYGDEESNALRIPPPLYLPSHAFGREAAAYVGYPADVNSGGEEPLVLTENYRPISPPAEYAAKSSQAHNERYRYNYQRSYSHSHEVANPDERAPYTAGGDYNINSHKSLPDLHTQISRHSPHSEILSCCSRGNRSIKSAGESSINRDSGGSSGHYTHRSEPCYKRQREPNAASASTIKNCCNLVAATRRDSGSSTQHSANSYGGRNTDCIDCRCKQDTTGGQHMLTSHGYDNGAGIATDYLLNFMPTPEVPEAFQDDYTPTPPSPSPRLKQQQQQQQQQTTPRYSSSSSQQLHTSSQGYTSFNHSQSSLVQSPGSAPSMDDISPPPIQFKRQRCIRFKNRNRLPAQPRTSPINTAVECHSGAGSAGASAGYKRNVEHENIFFPKGFSADGYAALSQSQEREALNASISELEKFFDRLGLNDEAFHEIYSQPRRHHNPETDSDDSSTVFFSDVSTVDSMRLPDSTETQPQTTQPYRPSEPPSIVERNARIIKWLCNCKKVQCA